MLIHVKIACGRRDCRNLRLAGGLDLGKLADDAGKQEQESAAGEFKEPTGKIAKFLGERANAGPTQGRRRADVGPTLVGQSPRPAEAGPTDRSSLPANAGMRFEENSRAGAMRCADRLADWLSERLGPQAPGTCSSKA